MPTISEVASSFDALADRIESVWFPVIAKGKTFLESQGWPHVALTPEDAVMLAKDVAERVRQLSENPKEDASTYWSSMASQAAQVTFANFANDPNTVSKSTFDFLIVCWINLPARAVDVDWEKVKGQSYIPRELSRRISSMEGRLKALEPRAELVQTKIEAIEAAHDAADRLPTDMEELRRSNSELRSLLTEAVKNSVEIEQNQKYASEHQKKIESLYNESSALVDKCNENYRITTSAGLAGAFEQRSRMLSRTAWVWVTILAVSLISAVVIGSGRLDGFKSLLTQNVPTSLVVLNILAAVISVGGPVWLAWLATRNIGQSFRLAEDYAFKASISKAYEGYRKEAVNLDAEFAKRLFGSALTRLDEAPSRFLSERDHNSPIEAVLDSPAVRAILEKFPELKDKLFELGEKHLPTPAISLNSSSAREKKKPAPKEEAEDS